MTSQDQDVTVIVTAKEFWLTQEDADYVCVVCLLPVCLFLGQTLCDYCINS